MGRYPLKHSSDGGDGAETQSHGKNEQQAEDLGRGHGVLHKSHGQGQGSRILAHLSWSLIFQLKSTCITSCVADGLNFAAK